MRKNNWVTLPVNISYCEQTIESFKGKQLHGSFHQHHLLVRDCDWNTFTKCSVILSCAVKNKCR
jgi:hypothetical protein